MKKNINLTIADYFDPAIPYEKLPLEKVKVVEEKKHLERYLLKMFQSLKRKHLKPDWHLRGAFFPNIFKYPLWLKY